MYVCVCVCMCVCVCVCVCVVRMTSDPIPCSGWESKAELRVHFCHSFQGNVVQKGVFMPHTHKHTHTHTHTHTQMCKTEIRQRYKQLWPRALADLMTAVVVTPSFCVSSRFAQIWPTLSDENNKTRRRGGRTLRSGHSLVSCYTTAATMEWLLQLTAEISKDSVFPVIVGGPADSVVSQPKQKIMQIDIRPAVSPEATTPRGEEKERVKMI